MYILANTFFQNIMRQFFFNIDKIVFGLISKLYDLLTVIARTSPLSQGDITDMAGRIYSLLAIFMVFKVTFSLIMYVVNPDDFTEKSKGVGNLIKNIILSLALLVLTPFIFRYAYQLQEIILEDNSLAALVFGDKKVNNGFFNSAGDNMAYTAISPFFVPDTSIDQLNNCTTLTINGKFNPACSGIDNNSYNESTDPEVDKNNTMLALTKLTNGKESSKFTETTLKNYVAGVNNANMGLTFRSDMALATFKDNGEDRYIIDYSYFVSTAVGIVIALLLVSFCMDIGTRSIKLAFLQLIAPIPIISYVDPKSGKDGLFKKWYKMCFSTFISLFVRLLVIYFAVYIISMVADHKLVDVVDSSYVTSPFVSLFILIGALMFAKQFPKILENLGIKLDGGGKFTLNPLKKLSEEAVGGKQIGRSLDNLKKDGFGVGLATKKLISGIDSARAGKGFMNGVRRIEGHGALSRASKWYHDQTPNRTEQIKKSREAKADLNYKKKLYDEGKARLNMASDINKGKTIRENISDAKKDMASDFVDEDGNAALQVNGNLSAHFQALGEALIEQYGGNTAKNREYARVAVEKEKAELEMRRLQAIQRRAYDPNTGKFSLASIPGAKDISGNAIGSAEDLEAAIEKQRKALESVSEYQTKEKEFMYKNAYVDSAISTSKGIEPRAMIDEPKQKEEEKK